MQSASLDSLARTCESFLQQKFSILFFISSHPWQRHQQSKVLSRLINSIAFLQSLSASKVEDIKLFSGSNIKPFLVTTIRHLEAANVTSDINS